MNRLTFNLKQLTLFLVAACGISSASAAITYSYTGNPFDTIVEETAVGGTYSNTDFVSISFTVPALLRNMYIPNGVFIHPTSYTLSDGRNTTTLDSYPTDNFALALFQATTDAAGNILDWGIATFALSDKNIISSNSSADRGITRECLYPHPFFPSACGERAEEYGEILGNPGFWEITHSPSPVPLLGGAWLFGSALIGLLGMARRQSRA